MSTLLKKRLVFSCEFYEISKNTFSYRAPPMPASEAVYRLLMGVRKDYAR